MADVVMGYCVSCKEKREMQVAEEVTMKMGQKALKGNCGVCGTGMYKILGSERPRKKTFEFELSDDTNTFMEDYDNYFDKLYFEAAKQETTEHSFDLHIPKNDTDLIKVLSVLNTETAKHLYKNPEVLYSIPADYFEKLVADVFSYFGFEIFMNVSLSGPGHGDEADIIAFQKVAGLKKPVGYIIECKRFAKHRKVDLRLATHLFGMKELHAEKWGLDHAILATTSSVTTEVKKQFGNRYDFEIKEHKQIVEWLKLFSERNMKWNA